MDEHQNKTWADWLPKAEKGDKEALTAMRYRSRKSISNYSLSGVSSDICLAEWVDSITKEGTEIYKVDKAVIRNNGKEIKISKGGSIGALKKALEMARQQYGNCIRVNGSPLFKKIILQIVVQNNMPITFVDRRWKNSAKLTVNLEKHIEQSKQSGLNARRRPPRGNEITGASTTGKRRFFTGRSPTLLALDKARQPKIKTA